MEGQKINTYCNGYSLISQKNITKNDFIHLCKSLTNEIGIDIEPESITEGGLVYKFNDYFPEYSYKSVRLSIKEALCTEDGRGDDGKLWFKDQLTHDKWPWIDNVGTWVNNDDIVLPRARKIPLFLKSFGGAPPFTIEELEIFEACFAAVGLQRVGKLPVKNPIRVRYP